MAGKIATAMEKYYAENKNSQGFRQQYIAGPAATSSRPEMQEAHLSDYLEVLARRKWVVILLFIIIVGSVTAYSVIATPQYEATAQILLGGRPTPMNPLGETAERLPERNLYFQTQVNLLSSRTLAHKVIDQLSLEDVFALQSRPNPFLAFASLTKSADDKEFEDDPASTQNSGFARRLKVLNWYLKHLIVSPIRDSSLVHLSFTGPDAELITQIVNQHAKTAIENTIQQNQTQAKEALDWLRAQIEEQKKEVERSQRAIYEFKKKNNVLSLEDSQIIFSQELQELNSALTKAKSERISKQAIYLQLQEITKNRQNAMLMPEISNYSVIQNLRNKLIDLKSDQIEMGTKYGPKHPKMVELKNGIRQLQNEIDIETKRLKNSIEADLNRARAIEASITQSLEKQKQVAMKLGERAIEYDVLKQQTESSQDIYDFLLKQSEELGLSSAISSSNMRIVDKAEIPIDPVRPKILLNILLAVFIALFAGTGCAFFVEYLDNTVKTPMDVAVRLGLPVLGMIPFQKSLQGKDGYVPLLEDRNYPAKGENALPIYHISNRLPDELRSPAYGLFGRVLLVESVTSNEGKTTVIARIASNLTEAGLRVLLVDCDFQRPSLDKLFKVHNGSGLGRSIDRIMSHHLTSGTLGTYSMDDLFFLIELKKLSGHLMVKNDDQTFIAHFQNGVLIHIENQNIPENHRIGNMLLNGGFITKNQLSDALKRHQRTGQPLGYILVNAGYIGREKLRGPLRLQIEEYLQKIFSWRNGTFSFQPGMIHIYENEKIFFEEDYTPMINNLGRVENSKFIEEELFSHITELKKDSLYLLPAGTSHKLIGGLNQILMKKIFEKLRQRFDVVLLDTPPLDAASGIESILQLADGIVLVIKAGHLSIKNLNGAINHLPKDKIIGTILNQAEVNPQNYYY
jgi:polysaccharide biosynthesis transport protein